MLYLFKKSLLLAIVFTWGHAFCEEVTPTQTIKQEIDTVFAQDPYFIKRRQMQDEELKKQIDFTKFFQAYAAQEEDKGFSYHFDRGLNTGMIEKLVESFDEAIYLSPEAFPKLHAMVSELCSAYKIPEPFLFFSEKKDFYQAAAVSFLASQGVVIMTKDLVDDMTDQQLRAVLAHELAHIKYNHAEKKLAVFIGTYAAGVMALGLSCYALRKSLSTKDLLTGGIVGALGFILLERYTSELFSRRCEQEADDSAGAVLGDPTLLASALKQIVTYAENQSKKFEKEHLFVLEQIEELVKDDPSAAADVFGDTLDRAGEVRRALDDLLYDESGMHPCLITRIKWAEAKCCAPTGL